MDTLNSTYKDASTQYQETNADIIASRQAQERLTDAMAEVGRVGEPIMTAVKNAIASMAETAVPIIENLVNKFRDAVTWIKKNEETVQTWVGVILGATVTVGTFLLILNWSKIMTAAANAIKVVRLAVLGFNAALLANPVGVVVALLAGLVAAFIYLWNNVEGFRKFWVKAWDLIKSSAQKAWTAIKNAFNSIGTWFSGKFKQVQKAGQDAMNNVKKWFSDAYKSVTKTFSGIGSWFGNKFRSAMTAIKNAFSGWGSFFSGLWGKVKSKFGSIGSSIGTAMGNAVKNGMNGALSKVESAINKGIGLINSAIRLANKLPGINVGTVGRVSLPRLAKGGVLERGQVGILEGSGAEAVVPLENNKAWLSRLANDLDQIQSQKPQNIMNDRMETLMEHIIVLLEGMQNRQICLDSGVLVGELAEPINKRLGVIYNKNNRGYTR
jgi:phage-related protein